MGNFDKWSTPKQIKIERAGEPRVTGRGLLKKGKRKKGKKARIDELLSARMECLKYSAFIMADRETRRLHPEWYRPVKNLIPWDPRWEESFDEALSRLSDLLLLAVTDGVIGLEDIEKCMVLRP